MKEEPETRRDTRRFSLVAIIIAIVALIAGVFFPITKVDDTIRPLTYENIAPLVKDYLVKNDIISSDGLIKVPDTSGEPDTKTIEEVIDQLIADGSFDYLKGEKGDTGAAGIAGATGAKGEQGIPGSYAAKGDQGEKGDTGATGATGAQGPKGDKGDTGATGATGQNGQNGQDGLITAVDSAFVVSGGTLTLKPCAVNQVLMVNSSQVWDCATVSAGGVDANTTNVSASLTLSGTSLQSSITDSDGNTVTSPPLDLNSTFATDTEFANAITTAITGLNLSQYATQTNLTDAIGALNISQYATASAVNSAITAATSNLVSQTDLTNAISTLNLSQYATTASLSALATRVSTLETTSTDHESRIIALETDIAQGYVTDTELTTVLGNYYTKSETYTQTEVNSLLNNKQNSLPSCADSQVIKYDLATTTWICADDTDTDTVTNLAGYATEQWVTDKNYATTTALNNLLPTNLLPGTGINLVNNNGVITINSTAQTDVFEVVPDHTAVATPDPNKIYIDTGTNPASQWVYENSTWTQIGEVNAEMTDYYTKTQTDSAIASAIGTNNANYTTTTDLTTLLAGKQDNLPTCTDGQVVKYTLATNTWDCANDNNTVTDLTGYAAESYVNTQIATNNNNYTTTTDLTTLLAAKADQTALDSTNTALSTETTNRGSADTALSDRLDTVEASAATYVPKSALNCSTTQALVGTGTNGTINCQDITNITTGSLVASGNLITANTLATSLASYYDQTTIDTMLAKYVKYGTAIPSGADLNTYITPGMYRIVSDVIATSISNTPLDIAGSILVEETANQGAKQTYTAYTPSNPRTFIRTVWNNTWGAWSEIATDSTLNNMNLVTGTDQSYKIQVVTAIPATPDPNTFYVILEP